MREWSSLAADMGLIQQGEVPANILLVIPGSSQPINTDWDSRDGVET